MASTTPNLFIPYPENAYFVTGKRQWKALWRGLIIIGFLIGMMLIT